MKTNLVINSIEEQTSKTTGHKFWILKSDDESFSCFKKDVVDKLKESLGDNVIVETLARGDYKNIIKFIEPADEKIENPQPKINHFTEARASKDQMMLTSYTKDIFCCLTAIEPEVNIKATMKAAIKLIKQARNAFGGD